MKNVPPDITRLAINEVEAILAAEADRTTYAPVPSRNSTELLEKAIDNLGEYKRWGSDGTKLNEVFIQSDLVAVVFRPLLDQVPLWNRLFPSLQRLGFSRGGLYKWSQGESQDCYIALSPERLERYSQNKDWVFADESKTVEHIARVPRLTIANNLLHFLQK